MTQRIDSRHICLAVGATVAAIALAGCSKSEQTDARDAASDTIAKVEQKADKAGRDASKALDKGVAKMKDATADASAKLSEKIDDAIITTSVKTEIAKDARLSAVKVEVETDNGRVALRGTAPSKESREHATTLAQNVKGVVSVDNRLTVAPEKM